LFPAIPDVKYARYHGETAVTLANRHVERTCTYPILARSPLFESPASPSARRRGPVQRGAAETRDSKRAAASHAWLARVRVSPSPSLPSFSLLLRRDPAAASLSFSLSRTCEPADN